MAKFSKQQLQNMFYRDGVLNCDTRSPREEIFGLIDVRCSDGTWMRNVMVADVVESLAVLAAPAQLTEAQQIAIELGEWVIGNTAWARKDSKYDDRCRKGLALPEIQFPRSVIGEKIDRYLELTKPAPTLQQRAANVRERFSRGEDVPDCELYKLLDDVAAETK